MPRDRELRDQKLKEIRGEDPMSKAGVGIQLTREQADALRETLKQFDAQNGRDENVFDPNKPPKEQYKHQEFPKMLYGQEGKQKGHVLTVNSADEEEAALEQGYTSDPHPEHDYSSINRNGMMAREIEEPEDENEEDAEEAAEAVAEAEKKAKARKKAGKSKSKAKSAKPALVTDDTESETDEEDAEEAAE
jgi:uncharacterized protein (DUF2267 family)